MTAIKGGGEQGPSSPHLLHAETTQKALSLPPPWQQIRTVCLDGWRHRGGSKKTGCVVVVKGMTTMTPSDFLFFPFQKNFDFLDFFVRKTPSFVVCAMV